MTSLQVRVALVHQDVSIPCLAILHVDNGLVGILERSLLDPGANVLLNRQLQHFLDIRLDIVFGTRPIGELTLISPGEPMMLPPILTPFAIKAKALNAGILSSGAPTWMKVPLLRKSWR